MCDSIVWQFDDSLCSDVGDAIKFIRDLVERLESSGWNNRDVFGVHMAMEEAVMNAIKHGNCSDCSKKVHMDIRLTETDFYARITDDGDGFDPNDVPDPTDDENLEKTSGRGVMLMKNFVDKVVYSEKGNSVELFKSRTDD